VVRSELLQQLCNYHPNLLRRDLEKILNIIFAEISEALQRNENVEIRGFGIFKRTLRKARIGINPKNLKPVQIQEKKAIKWKMSKKLYRLLNKI
tara:strand:- start:109 stop:390 length:282 start_codon:yes stop_codon:yes gene_type:complete